jgi:predicted nicotinamide N-methyase
VVAGRRVLDFGAGGGVEAIAAMKSGARSVLATDIDPLAIAALELNAARNGVAIETSTRDLIGVELEGFDLILAGDVCYAADESARILGWLLDEAERGREVLIGDPGRGHLSGRTLRAIAEYQAPVDVDHDGSKLVRTTVWAACAVPRPG